MIFGGTETFTFASRTNNDGAAKDFRKTRNRYRMGDTERDLETVYGG
jgi:hypothetical protein